MVDNFLEILVGHILVGYFRDLLDPRRRFVDGNLTLDGILNVGNGGSFGAGAMSTNIQLCRLQRVLPVCLGSSGTFFGPAEGRNSVIIDAGVSVQWTPTLSSYINYDGQLGRDLYGSNAVTGGFRVGF
jgi:hypothetical protein